MLFRSKLKRQHQKEINTINKSHSDLLKSETSDLYIDNRHTAKENTSLKTQLEHPDNKLRKLSDKLDELEAKVFSLCQQLQWRTQDISCNRDQLKQKQLNLKQSKLDTCQLQQQNKQISKDLSAATKSHSFQIEDLLVSNSVLKKQNDELEANLLEIEVKTSTIEKQNLTLLLDMFYHF